MYWLMFMFPTVYTLLLSSSITDRWIKPFLYRIPRLMIVQKKCSCYSHREMLWLRHLAGEPALSLSFQNLAHRIQKSIPTIGKSSRIFLKICYFFYFCFSSPLKYIYLTVAAKWSLWRKMHCGEFCATQFLH